MTSLRAILGRSAVSRASAEDLGTVQGAVVDHGARRVESWQIGKGRKARLIEHGHLTGMGAAAVIVDDEVNLRDANSAEETATIKNHRNLLGAYLLSDAGNALGDVADADIDSDSGAIVSVTSESEQFPAEQLRGFGTYALVIAQPTAPPRAPSSESAADSVAGSSLPAAARRAAAPVAADPAPPWSTL